MVLEIGNRAVTAGFAGDASPRCIVPVEFGWNRVVRTQPQYFDDYRRQDEGGAVDDSMYHSFWSLRELQDTEARPGQPWYARRPLRRFETLLEVILTHVFLSELLVDARQQRVAIVENPLWPSGLRESIAKVCLKTLHVASIVFLESPVLDLIAAGLRCGIVVDVGWEETTVYPVYDLRVLLMNTKTSIRGSKKLHGNVKQVLEELAKEQAGETKVPFNVVESVVLRALFTDGNRSRLRRSMPPPPVMVVPGTPVPLPGADNDSSTSHQLDMSSWSAHDSVLDIPNQRLQASVSTTFLQRRASMSDKADENDDDELDLASMIFKVICSLSMDVRGATQSTIVFVGGASQIPGLVSKVLQDTRSLLRKRDIAAASSVMAAKSMGSWTGASLYMSSLAWYFAQDERIRLPGELSRERYASAGYERSTVPFGVIW